MKEKSQNVIAALLKTKRRTVRDIVKRFKMQDRTK